MARAVGIDLGTTNSVIAAVEGYHPNGDPERGGIADHAVGGGPHQAGRATGRSARPPPSHPQPESSLAQLIEEQIAATTPQHLLADAKGYLLPGRSPGRARIPRAGRHHAPARSPRPHRAQHHRDAVTGGLATDRDRRPVRDRSWNRSPVGPVRRIRCPYAGRGTTTSLLRPAIPLMARSRVGGVSRLPAGGDHISHLVRGPF
jgi:hypothetical protein